ncbi:uncharacterized protein EV154DRAFT_412048 [Mucor mucedo]|uniref:uncharacterized protein n=1 Tax=Mucor mucedo TaxID=29922 RepID=UPI00221F5CC3|nr:uncharacterized protein EV154DRAFT_412048 [Mucor mucedo]KAI7896243.1 hypothetical protein EV154DRAFT_412048 [Mucor mucedo]
MDLCRQEIKNAKAEIERLKASNALGMDKRDVLRRTLDYFEQKEQEEGNEEGLESLKYVLNSVKDKIDARLADLENIILDQADKMHQVFDKDDMKENGYELRASFHHDGKDGTGHYWAYIWVEPMEPNLLQDIPSEGGWFRFCDAYVIASSETELYNDPYPPFALMYANETIPKYTQDQLSECIPESLKGFISADNDFLYQEIQAKERTNDQGTASLISTSDDDVEFAEKQDSANCLDLESSSATFDDNISVGTAVGHTTNEYSEPQQYSFTGQGFSKLKERVNSKIMQVVDFDSDDYRLLMSFENFLARTQNQLLLEHLYLLYSSDEVSWIKNQLVDEEASKTDDELKIIWHEYETFINIAGMVTQALSYFANQDFSSALQSLLDAKRHEASWKDGLLLDLDVSSAFSGLTTISFNNIVEKYGKECLKILNKAAYKKASNESYRTRGLEDAIRIAYQAQTIIGPDNIQTDQIYQSLGELWLTFTEQQNVGSSLTDTQVELLNTLVMTYLEGQGGGSIGIPSRGESPVDNSVDDEKDNDLPLWQKYQQVCSQSEHVLTTLSNKQ